MNSAFVPCGRTWLNTIIMPTCTTSTAITAVRTARNLPHTYSEGLSGVEWSNSPTRASSSRIMDMPAATEAKNT
jgi:hypothetical protein